NGRDEIAPIPLYATCKQHELVTRRPRANLEPFIGVLRQDAGPKRSEVFPVLDLLIENIAHVRSPRVGEQRAVTQRTRPELHATLKPGNYLATGNHCRGLARGVSALPRPQTGRLDRSQNVAPPESGPQIWGGVAPLGWTLLLRAMHDQGGADRRTRIVGRGRYEHIGKLTGSPDHFIG